MQKTYEVLITDQYSAEGYIAVTVEAHTRDAALEDALNRYNCAEEYRTPNGRAVEYANIEDVESVKVMR